MIDHVQSVASRHISCTLLDRASGRPGSRCARAKRCARAPCAAFIPSWQHSSATAASQAPCSGAPSAGPQPSEQRAGCPIRCDRPRARPDRSWAANTHSLSAHSLQPLPCVAHLPGLCRLRRDATAHWTARGRCMGQPSSRLFVIVHGSCAPSSHRRASPIGDSLIDLIAAHWLLCVAAWPLSTPRATRRLTRRTMPS